MKQLVLIILTSFIFLIGCEEKSPLIFKEISKNREKNRNGNDGSNGNGKMNESVLSFENLQKNILIPRCKQCHFGPGSYPRHDPIDFTSYKTMMVKGRFIPLLLKGNPERSRLFNSVTSGRMPKRDRLADEDIEYIKKWIEACAPDASVEEVPDECPKDDDDEDEDEDEDEFDDEDEF